MSTCTVSCCDRPAKHMGLCPAHYQRLTAGKPLDSPISGRGKAKGQICSVGDCQSEVWSKGMCRFHDARRRTDTLNGLGDKFLDLPKHYRTKFARGWVHKGYRWITVDGREVMEHRDLMERHIGRKLSYDEVVHHIDGDKLNNNISNLEILLRGPHTSHHRKHQTPCKVCGRLDKRKDGKGYNGSLGYCTKHYQMHRTGKL